MSSRLKQLFANVPIDDDGDDDTTATPTSSSPWPTTDATQQATTRTTLAALSTPQPHAQGQHKQSTTAVGSGLAALSLGTPVNSSSKQRPAYKSKAPGALQCPSPHIDIPQHTEPARAIGDEEGLKGEIGKLYIDGNVFTITTLEKDFEIGAELGHGTFGCVKTAVHRATNTTLAVKLLRDTMRADEKEKLIKELTLSRKFDSPYTVRYHGINVFDGQIQLFVEKMRMSLDSMIKYTKRAKQRVPEAVLGHITCCLIKGLDYMWHTHRAMHRDIKPSNALIGFDGSIKLCDFGLANIAVDSILISNVGSELYLSPEQLDPTTCQQGYDVRRDVWSLGVTLLEIANLEYPFRSEAEKYASAFTVMNRVTRGLIPRVKYEYSPSFQDLISSCLETDARWRPYFRVCAQPLKRLGSGSSSTASRQNSVTGRPDAHRLASIGDENPFAADMRESRDGGVGSGSQRSPAAGVSNHADTRGNAVASPASATSLATQSPHVSAEELAKREGKTIHPALMEHEFFKQYDKVELNVANWIDSLLRLPDMAM